METNEEIRLRCIEAAAKQTSIFLETVTRAEKFFNFVKGIKESPIQRTEPKVTPQTQEAVPAAARPKKAPINLAENVKAFT